MASGQSIPNLTARIDRVPVLIVGGGPTGLLCAYLLSKFGMKSLVVEKYPRRLAAPKAHAICPRSFEICRQFGLDTTALRRLGSQREDAFWVNFVTNLSGERIGVLPYERMDVAVLDDTPEMIHNVPQPEFENFLSRELQGDPNVEIRKNTAFVSCAQTDEEVISVVQDRGMKTSYQIQSRFVIGSDGAKSQVRSALGIESDGEDSYETMMTIHFNADLRPVLKDRVGMLHWITDPACSGFIIGYDLSGNEVLISNFDPSKRPVETWDEQACREVVTAAIGQDVPFVILSYRPWILSKKISKQYHKGNVFLAGDAAHSFPPTGGLGLNSGLADVHNLAYKTAAVHQGWAGKKLLDSYVAERLHIAEVNSAQSVKNGKQIFSFLKTLGTAGIDDVEEARANLHKSIHDPDKQEMIAREIEGQREHFDNLEIHIGYVYGSREVPPHASKYTPKFIPGARLPHAWITLSDSASTNPPGLKPLDVSYIKEWGRADVDARKFSILDLCGFDCFTVIVGDRNRWQNIFDQLRATFSSWRDVGVKLQLYSMGSDFEFIFEKHSNLFRETVDLCYNGSGGLVVRPDQHILAVINQNTTGEELESALRTHIE